MNSLLTFLALLLCAIILFITPADGASALLVCIIIAVPVGLLISRTGSNKTFLLHLFVGALLMRLLLGLIIYTLNMQEFFGGDALTYDYYGFALMKGLQGDHYYYSLASLYIGRAGAGGWGMLYLIAIIYGIVGRNMLAIQFINAVLGAAIAPVIFLCAQHIFNNLKVSKISALFAAFYPSLIL